VASLAKYQKGAAEQLAPLYRFLLYGATKQKLSNPEDAARPQNAAARHESDKELFNC